MKQYHKIIAGIILTIGVSACTDETLLSYSVEKPESLIQYEYLNNYDVLKSYVDRAKYPDFKLGLAIIAGDFNSKGAQYEIAKNNFNEITAGNCMKYSSCVRDDGSMDFSTVEKLIKTAKSAGLTLYGHTLAWHSQQNNTYLNGLVLQEGETLPVQIYNIDYSIVTDKYIWHQPESEPVSITDGYLVIKNPSVKEVWGVETIIADEIKTTIGDNYMAYIKMKSSGAGSAKVLFTNWGKPAVEQNIAFEEGEQEIAIQVDNIQTDNTFMLMQSGSFAGTLQIASVRVSQKGGVGEKKYVSLIENGDAEGEKTDNYRKQGAGTYGKPIIGEAGTGSDGKGHAFIIESPANQTYGWDTQFFLTSNQVLKAGDKVHLSFKYRADKDTPNIGTQSQGNPTEYIHWDGGAGISFTTSWQTFERTMTISADQAGTNGMKTIAWNLADCKEENTFYFDDIVFEREEIVEGGTNEGSSMEEKKEILIQAMDTWIGGMMQACGGYVTAWDAVNEPLSGTDIDGDGFFDLQSATRNTVSENDKKSNFYWQDYLGDVDYVRTVVKLARKHFAETGGNPNDLKLFINDYNLESAWDDNHKLKSLIKWIEKWEADGVTQIDGIGTQMHISCNMNDEYQRDQERHVVQMFELLAKTGKLVKISELDMGLIDDGAPEENKIPNSNNIKTECLTFVQHLAMADFYQFIVSKYLEIIPVEQQYGITQWCSTDSPVESGWRANQPIGLWNLQYQRKPAYAGFANGLAGETIAEPDLK